MSLELFMDNLKHLIDGNNHNPLINNPSVLLRRPQFQLLFEELDFIIQTLFIHQDHHLHELPKVRHLKRRFKDAVEEAQDITDLFLSAVHYRSRGLSPRSDVFKTSLNLEDVMRSIESIKMEVMTMNIDNMKMDSSPRIDRHKTQSASACTRNPSGTKKLLEEIVVGLDREADLIRDKLAEDQKQLDVISIVGMGGLGKTTLATKVFNDRFVVYHFHVRAWATVSQTYIKRDVLIQVLSSIGVHLHLEEASDFQLREKLHKQLMGKRYLIVIDDIWSIEAWDDLQLFFPRDNTGSRILLTTRLHEVALHAKPHDSWSFNSVGKDFASDESLSTADAFGGSMGWEVKAPSIFGNNMGLLPNEISIENQVFGDMCFPPSMRNSLFNPVMGATQNAFSEENESCFKLESNSGESGLFDLKLGRLNDQKEVQIFNASKIAHNSSASEVSMPSKRPREGGFGSSTPFCKVYGCNKNLSKCKDYHRRHKVCEVHSKTAIVIVNGIEQRFCQQCSRFHLLREFDDGKRSCRKRLAGHNERRRKPHVGTLYERHRRLLPSYNIGADGNKSKGSTSSFLIPNHLRRPYQQSNGRWQMNLEDRMGHDLQSISCSTDEQLHSESLSPCNFETNRRFDGFINGYVRDSTSAPTRLSGMASSSESALSLLSYQSRSTCNSSRILTSNSLSHPMFPRSHHELTEDSGQLHQHDMNPMLGFEGGLVKFGIDGMFQGSKHMNSEDPVFPDEGCTIDLLQLSSQLERVDHQKRSSRLNHANGVSVGLRIT